MTSSSGHEVTHMIADDGDRTFLSRARSSRGVMTGGHCVIMLNIGTGSGSSMRE